jgi:DNA invertase Pin-like site-specific DNA recombinase
VESAESPGIDTVVVHRLHVLGTSSDVLLALLSLFQAKGIRVITQRPEQRPDPAEAFAAALLKPCAQYETDDEMERRRGIRRRKLDEIERLRVKLARLEAEIAED